jgi:hypothetical protein
MAKAAGFFDSAPLKLECPVCGDEVVLTLGEGRRATLARCADGHPVDVDGSSLDRELRAIEDRLESSRHFGRLSTR